MRYRLAPVRTVAPSDLLVSVDDAKAHLRVDTADEDALIEAMIVAATEHLDGWAGILGRCLATQTWRQDLPGFGPQRTLRLPLGPVESASITYLDPEEEVRPLDQADLLGPFHDALGPYLMLKAGRSWPATALDRPDAVSVLMVVGYGDADDVPLPIRQAVKLILGDWYEVRSTAIFGATATVVPVNTAANALLAPYRRVGF